MATFASSSFLRLPALVREQRYRRHFFEADRRQTTLVVLGMTVVGLLTLRNDIVLLQGTDLGFAITCKGLFLLASFVALMGLHRARSPQQHDCSLACWLVVWSIYLIGLFATRYSTAEYLGPVIGQCASLTVLYYTLNGPIMPRILAANTTTIAVLVLVWKPTVDATPATRFITTMVAILGNLFGIAWTRAFETNRRMRFDAERQLAIKVRELAAEKEHALALSRTRTAFLATMSHEFRTPMNAVIGLSDLLLEAPLTAEHRNHVRAINESARALLTQLNDILDFAKIDADKLVLSPAPFDARALAASVVDMLRPAAVARGLELSLDVAPEVSAHLTADDARLRQVLVNLVSNAIKFTERGGVTLRMATSANVGDVNGNQEIAFRVEDTGIGIEPETLPRLFKPFEQAPGVMVQRQGGVGLGLAISRRIVRAMGGDLLVESEFGRGTTFSFVLRLPVADPPAETRVLSFEPQEARPPLAILVVDDLALNREVARGQLGRLGYRVDLAASGPEALAAISRKSYDIVFMDLRMPGMNGIEATRLIRDQFVGRRGPCVVAMTASVFEEDREACRLAGMLDFLPKPMDILQVEAVLCRVVEERGVIGANDAQATLAPEQLAKLRQVETLGESNFLMEVCRRFMTDLAQRVQKIEEAQRRGDLPRIEDEAHALRATSAAVGATVLAELCGRVEGAARAGQLEETAALLDRLAAQVPEVRRALVTEMGEEA
jgi:signal transduction histidine kinase/CheY-like chemotaxis protein